MYVIAWAEPCSLNVFINLSRIGASQYLSALFLNVVSSMRLLSSLSIHGCTNASCVSAAASRVKWSVLVMPDMPNSVSWREARAMRPSRNICRMPPRTRPLSASPGMPPTSPPPVSIGSSSSSWRAMSSPNSTPIELTSMMPSLMPFSIASGVNALAVPIPIERASVRMYRLVKCWMPLRMTGRPRRASVAP